MNQALVVTLAVTAVVVAVASGAVVLVSLSGRRRLRAELAAARADVDVLRARIDALATAGPAEDPGRERPEFVITSLRDDAGETVPRPPSDIRAGRDVAVPETTPSTLSAGEFASVALGESLVRVLSFGYGVRRALSAENRNRIRFEIRREVKRSRRQRRRDLKEAKRHLRADQRADLTEDAA